MYKIYSILTGQSEWIISRLLSKRCLAGKEDLERYTEKKAQISLNKPDGPLLWIHAASIGEAQSTLILIDYILKHYKDLNILVTTGTLTSAKIMAKSLPKQAFHQFYPLDHPKWVESFLDHWKPNMILWMESELWPNMLHSIKKRQIPSILINARMSDKSFKYWRFAKRFSRNMLSCFEVILCQTSKDKELYSALCDQKIIVTDNLKYSATPLTANNQDLENLRSAIGQRPIWLYASTHDGEEIIAYQIHKYIKYKFPNLLTIIVPRHPDRRDNIIKDYANFNIKACLRGEAKNLPTLDDDIYIADTLGELGLFYQISPIACIGRSFSKDGGGGHNPIEAAQLNCAILHGPNIQNLQDIFDEMDANGAALSMDTPNDLRDKILYLLENPADRQDLQDKALSFAKQKDQIIARVTTEIAPILNHAYNRYKKNQRSPDTCC